MPLFFNSIEERENPMFSFEVLVGSLGHKAMFQQLMDLAEQGKEVHYTEEPGTIYVTELGLQKKHKIEGLIARGYAKV